MKTYMVKRAFSKKKKLNRHISRREKKRVLKSPHFEEKKKQALKSLKFVEDLGRFQAFFF
jgi:hypothetical protein